MLKADGFDDCIIGVAERFCEDGYRRNFIVYDREKMIKKLMKDGMTHEEADEYFEFNISGSYNGQGMPAFVDVGANPDEWTE